MGEPVRVMDIMCPSTGYPKLSPEHTIRQAWDIIGDFYRDRVDELRSGGRVALVLDEEEQLVGLLTLRSILDALDPQTYAIASRVPGGLLEEGESTSIAFMLPDLKVREIMLPGEKITLKSTDFVAKALQMLLGNNVGALPVLNIFHRVIGVVPAGEVFHSVGLRSSFGKLAFAGYDYTRHGVFDDYYVDYDAQEKKSPGKDSIKWVI